jgi:hypothetical protein
MVVLPHQFINVSVAGVQEGEGTLKAVSLASLHEVGVGDLVVVVAAGDRVEVEFGEVQLAEEWEMLWEGVAADFRELGEDAAHLVK